MSPLATFIAAADEGSRVLICPISSSLSSGNTQSHCVLSGSVLVGPRETPLKRRKVSISLSQATWTISAYKQRREQQYEQRKLNKNDKGMLILELMLRHPMSRQLHGKGLAVSTISVMLACDDQRAG